MTSWTELHRSKQGHYPATSDRVVLAETIPLPPLAEQKRIVAKVEALLAWVNAARERLSRVPAILKRFRQSVLASACSGRLTASWPPKSAAEVSSGDGALPEGWQSVQFKEVCEEITVGHVGPMAKEYVESGIPFLRSQNVREFRFEPVGLKFITPRFHQKLKKSALTPGDVVVVRSGNAGVACVIPSNLLEANCADLVIVRPGTRLDSQYAAIFLNSSAAKTHVEAEKVGIAQGHFNIGSMRKTPLPLPPVVEQHEIIRRVEALFALADSIETRVAATTRSAEKLPQAILAKAFRGELVPTEAELARQEGRDYEPASVLLDRIRAERSEGNGPAAARHTERRRTRKRSGC